MTHWMSTAAKRAGLPGADRLSFEPGTSVKDAWTKACQVCEMPPGELAQAIASAFSMEAIDLGSAEPTAARLLPGSVARKFCIFPVRDENRYLVVATPNPADPNADQEVGFSSGRLARFAVAPPTDIAGAIESTYTPDVATESLLAQLGDRGDDTSIEVFSANDEQQSEDVHEAELAAGPVVKLANIILHEAVQHRASDIHLQPLPSEGVVRFRTDGVLHNAMQVPLPVLSRVVSRIKIMAQLDITDRLRPQDGRARMVIEGRKYDLRVSTVPTRGAEKAVIRILDTEAGGTLVDTGIAELELARLRRALSNRDGIVVVTGPTGSGKTTTLYGALREISTDGVNIMTVEDPVEYELPGLTQIQVEQKQGMTFASALRAILRQDPDVIFVGEIRDAETAEIAAQASLTGHLVLSTLHTNDAVSSIARFMDLGLGSSTVTSTLRASLAQRLLRKICPHCAEPVNMQLTEEEASLAEMYGAIPVVRAVGCDECMGHGYLGRLPIAELLAPTPALCELIHAGASHHELEKQAVNDGMVTLRSAAVQRVRDGETTLQEVHRVVGGEGQTPQSAASRQQEREVGAEGPLQAAPEAAANVGASSAAPPPQAESTHTPSPQASSPGNGSDPMTATVPAPAVSTPARPAPAPPQPVQVAPVEEDENGDATPHVLIVDDDGTTRMIARGVMEKAGFQVSEAVDGSEALVRLARGEHFSLMLLDLDMPTINGRDVLRSVRQSMTTVGLPVVVLTGAADPNTEIELMEMGADDYLRKPIDPPLLSIRVKAAMRRNRGLATTSRARARGTQEHLCRADNSLRIPSRPAREAALAVIDVSHAEAGMKAGGRCPGQARSRPHAGRSRAEGKASRRPSRLRE